MYVEVNGLSVPKKIDMINRNCLYKKPGWFINMYNKKNSFFSSLAMAELFEEMRIILDNVYGENWAFNFVDFRSLPKLYILYPEIQISNSNGVNHTIRNLMVIIYLSKIGDKVRIENSIKGFRLTVDRKEYASNYHHSHLYPSKYDLTNLHINENEVQYFCLGENEVPEVAAIFLDNQEPGTFELYLMTLNSMMEWESLEGVPYFKISGLSEKVSSSKKEYYHSDVNVEMIFQALIDKSVLRHLTFDMDLNKMRVVENDFLTDFITSTLLSINPESLCFRSGDKFYTIEESRIPEGDEIKLKFRFKGEDIPFKIYNNQKPEEVVEEIGTSFQILPSEYNSVINKLNTYLYEKSVTHYSKSNQRQRESNYSR